MESGQTMSFFTPDLASCFALLTYSVSTNQADTFSQVWVSGLSPQITDATGKGLHIGWVVNLSVSSGSVANINNQANRSDFGQYWGGAASAYSGSDDVWIGYGRGASYIKQSPSGGALTVDIARSRSIIMRSE